VRPLTAEELRHPIMQHRMQLFNQMISDKYGDYMTVTVVDDNKPKVETVNDDSDSDSYVPYEDDVELPRSIPQSEVLDYNGKPIHTRPITDQLVGLELTLPQGEMMVPATVIDVSMDSDGKVIGNENENPILNTTLYDVQFNDGMIQSYAANTIAENVYNMVNADGESEAIFSGIIDHRSMNNAVSEANRFITVGNRKFPRKTTAGW
jgi:hypothetical protein